MGFVVTTDLGLIGLETTTGDGEMDCTGGSTLVILGLAVTTG